MKHKFKLSIIVLITAIFGIEPATVWQGQIQTFNAEAKIGRPATPGSVAGVSRRTTRRTIRRGRYYAALPAGCVQTTVYGYAVWQCGGTYYQTSGSGYVVVVFE